MWKPNEIIVHTAVRNDPVTLFFIQSCPDVPVRYVEDGRSTTITSASTILSRTEKAILPQVLAGKQVVYIAPAVQDVVDAFSIPDTRMMCPHFERLKLASNGCFYQCDWCYLKMTFRAAKPFITIRAEYDKIKDLIEKRLEKVDHRKRPANSILPEFSTDGMIVFGWSNAMAPVL